MARSAKGKTRRRKPSIDLTFAVLRRPDSGRGIPLWFPEPSKVKAMMEESVDRYMNRWARKLILVVDGEVRKLTGEEIESLRQPKRRARRGTK
jgi:hypothetical protein